MISKTRCALNLCIVVWFLAGCSYVEYTLSLQATLKSCGHHFTPSSEINFSTMLGGLEVLFNLAINFIKKSAQPLPLTVCLGRTWLCSSSGKVFFECWTQRCLTETWFVCKLQLSNPCFQYAKILKILPEIEHHFM